MRANVPDKPAHLQSGQDICCAVAELLLTIKYGDGGALVFYSFFNGKLHEMSNHISRVK